MCACFKVGVGMNIIRWLNQLQASMDAGHFTSEDRCRVDQYRRWLLRDASTIHNNSQFLLGTCAVQPKNSIVRHSAEMMVLPMVQDVCGATSLPYVVGSRVMGGFDDFDAMLSVLTGHSSDVWSVCWSPDGTCIASGSRDKTVRVWDVATGNNPSLSHIHA